MLVVFVTKLTNEPASTVSTLSLCSLFFSRGESPWLQISIVTEPPLFTAAMFSCLLRFAMDD
eukprot:scaffold33683_cov157-Skeletonema_dohrnii-CCMP3373.AAC.1